MKFKCPLAVLGSIYLNSAQGGKIPRERGESEDALHFVLEKRLIGFFQFQYLKTQRQKANEKTIISSNMAGFK